MQTSAPVQYVLAVKFGEGDEGPVAIGSGKRTYRHTETDNLVAKIAKNKKLKAEAEKKRLLELEKKRRTQGRFEGSMRDEGRRMAMKRKADLARKEKILARKERMRIKKQIELDKRERAAARALRGSPSSSKPVAPAAKAKPAFTTVPSRKPSAAGKAKAKVPPLRRVDAAVRSLLTYNADGEGLKALKILRLYMANALRKGDKEQTAKYRRINLGNNAFKTKVAPFQGGKTCLYAAGFSRVEPTDEFPEGSLVLEVPDEELLQTIKSRIEHTLTAAGVRLKKT